ncbi:hypothetical protein LPJ61_002126 [Coemansia biformis]|uniref:Homologous recombination OB-fold protein OB-fold domain-containing protein n=1 Tax=Coemansia biformis TaxID=1286918 RepID=A0A9W7YFL0_9FUNG|nr:hypothetical protein LPJ61_002126 [Coemansia biformis]
MFSPLQDALKKLRETKQTEQSQPKRAAVAAPQHPLATGDDLDDLDIGLDDADLFDDLATDDSANGSGRAGSKCQAGEPQYELPATHAGALVPPKPAGAPAPPPAPSQARLSKFSFRPAPDLPGAGPEKHPRTPLAAMPSQQGSVMSQADVYATPRPADGRGGSSGGAGSRSTAQARTITTTVVGRRAPRRLAAAMERQRIPGPAGILEDAAGSSVAPTQKPTSPFKTPLSRAVEGEQTGSADFEGGTWAAMLDHLGMPAYKPSDAKDVTRTVEAAAWPIRRVLDIARTQRIRIMLVQLREMGNSDTDTSVVVVDPTGEMEASIHRPVVKRFVHFLAAGTSIILKDVVAMKATGSRPFLVITAASIEQIFTSKGPGSHEDPIILSATQTSGSAPAQDYGGTPTCALVERAGGKPASERTRPGPMLGLQSPVLEAASDLGTASNDESDVLSRAGKRMRAGDGESPVASDDGGVVASEDEGVLAGDDDDDEYIGGNAVDALLDLLNPSQ